MRFSGTVTTQNFIPLSGFINPGSDFFGSDLTPFNYPAYNEVLGLYATLRTPEVEVLENNFGGSQTSVRNVQVEVDSSDFDDNFVPDYTRIDSIVWKSKTYHQNLFLKLKNPLKYALNQAIDFDTTNTKIYISFDVQLETDEPFTQDITNIQRIDSIRYGFSENTNLWVLHDISDGIHSGNLIKRKIEIVSGWYEAEDVTNLLFGSDFSTSVFYSDLYETDILNDPENYSQLGWDEFTYTNHLPEIEEKHVKYNPVKITMKVMADMYFDQLSYTGEKINTTQVFTYLLLDQKNGVNLIDQQGGFLPEDSAMHFVNMYPGELIMESNILFPNCPEIYSSNYGSFPLSVYADRIIINDDIAGLDGFNYNLEAYSEVKLKPGTHIQPNIRLAIERDVYDGEQSVPATLNELASFCQSNDYHSGNLSKSAKLAVEKRKELMEVDRSVVKENRSNNLIKLSPNPANSQIQITSTSEPITEIEIFDLSGRSLIHRKTGAEINTIAANVAALQSGVYIVQTLCGDQRSTEKLVIGK